MHLLDRRDLLCNDRENFQVDPVKFVEARPRAGHGQALEELAHGLGKISAGGGTSVHGSKRADRNPNSSKHAHAPDMARPFRNLPMA